MLKMIKTIILSSQGALLKRFLNKKELIRNSEKGQKILCSENSTMESELDHFIKTLRKNGTAIWLNTYFNTLQTLLQNLKINSNSPALAMNVTKGFELNSNIGQRWISKPYDGKYIGLLLPMEADESL